uniref:Si:dkey-10o6.2 n=1 Tax=Oryzias latipes TaxID=8090 RepID=A0A3P9K1E0_ORYLA
MNIPVVDFSSYSLEKEDVPDEQLHALVTELRAAFTEVGFVFLHNYGIAQELVDRAMETSRQFFLQPDEEKQPFSRGNFENCFNHGWVSMETESLNPSRPGDLKEAFNISSLDPEIKWPSKHFQEVHTSFFQLCKELSLRVLKVVALSLNLQPDVILSAHKFIGTSNKNGTTLRALYYPPLNSENPKEGQIRCGEHTDYGTFTLLFQGSEGLQVCGRSGEFFPAPNIPGAILLNIADLLQRWTSDQYISVCHRVLLPPAGDSCTRQSLAFFLHPDDEAVITCLDGSNKYPPITAEAHALKKLRDSYGKS